MQKSDNAPESGNVLTTGGWAISALAGALVFGVLYYKLGYYLLSSVAFGAAVGLIVLLLLLIAVSRSEPVLAPSRVRKIVPRPEQAVPDQPVMAAPVAAPLAITPMFAEPAPVVETSAPTATPVEAAPAALVADPSSRGKAKPKAAAKPKGATKPKAAPKPAAALAGPVRLKAARKGGADDLKEIEGIGPALEKLVNALGFYHFDQIADWSDADVALVDAEMKTFKGRIARDRWVAQAKIIATDGLEAFRQRAKTDSY